MKVACFVLRGREPGDRFLLPGRGRATFLSTVACDSFLTEHKEVRLSKVQKKEVRLNQA